MQRRRVLISGVAKEGRERSAPGGTFVGTALWAMPGAQPALHFGGSDFHEISFDDVVVLIQPWYNFFANGHI